VEECPACGERRFAQRTVVAGLRTRRCLCCGLVLSDISRTGPVTDEFELVNHDAYHASVGRVRRTQAAPLLSILQPYAGRGAALLDVGCSFGYFLSEARSAGFVVRGVEPDRQAVAYASAMLGDEVVEPGRLDAAILDGYRADVVASLDVLEHIPPGEQAEFARHIRRVLTPDGVWLVKVPTTEGLYYRVSSAVARLIPRVGGTLMRRLWQTDYEFVHTVYFDRRSLHRWLERYGFEPLEWHYLPEVPLGTAVARLTTDGRIPVWQARLLAPALYAVNAAEAVRRRSDSLVVLARRRNAG
jgi:SAM-dependent methyltransferase